MSENEWKELEECIKIFLVNELKLEDEEAFREYILQILQLEEDEFQEKMEIIQEFLMEASECDNNQDIYSFVKEVNREKQLLIESTNCLLGLENDKQAQTYHNYHPT